MPQSSVQFAPLERAQAVGTCRRRSVQFLRRETRRDMPDSSFSVPARNVGITWKVILLLWLLFLATLVLRASVPTPVLTSVTPNPVTSGTVNVTIKGTGFQSGVMVYQTYTGQSRIQYTPTTWSATSLTVNGIWQPATATVTFEVKNPGGSYSNALTVPVSASGGGGGGGGGGSTTYTLKVVNGKISGGGASASYASGTTVNIVANTPPSGEAFQSWTGTAVANPLASATSLVMPSANTTVTANFYTPTPIPTPVTTHPRLWITEQDLPRLEQWAATPKNVAFQGLSAALNAALANYTQAFPNVAGQSLTKPIPANPYPDFGDVQGYTGMLSEENAAVLALFSLIDTNSANRISYAQKAHNLLMYAMNKAVLGHATNTPFRDPAFIIYNRGSFGGHEWPLIVDWIYDAVDGQGHPILTAQDKQIIRRVFLLWANDCVNASTTGGDNPGLPGLENSLALLPNNKAYRMASNNYYLAHARTLTMMGLVLDPADDPPVNTGTPAAVFGNSLRSYINDGTGAWLYEIYAMMGDPQTVAQAYNVPNNPTGAGLGLASGGLPPEGMLYGESFAYVLGQLLALQTAGFNDPQYSGPQIGLIGAPVWDRYVQGYLSSLTPSPKVPPSETYLGAVYQFEGYGDMLRLYVEPDQMQSWALLALLDRERGLTTHENATRWFAMNAVPGGQSGLLANMQDFTTWGVTPNILYFLFLDPTAPKPTDPRPAFPTLFYDAPAGRIVAHSDWGPNQTIFDYRASWISINHQDGGSGQFGLYRKGEWLTKEMSNYDNGGGGNGATTTYHNTLSLENDCPKCSTITWGQDIDGAVWRNGSQWMEGGNAGDPSTVMSHGAGYVYAASNLTNLYNRPDIWDSTLSIVNVKQATRSIVWLNDTSDYVVVYDRATTQEAGLWKKWNLSLAATPQVQANKVSETMPDGQKLFVQTLLPMNPSQSYFNGAVLMSPLAELEPMKYIYQEQDSTKPADTRFLHVLQASDAATAMAQASYLQSTAGQQFNGAGFSKFAIYFPVNVVSFTGTTLTLPAGAHTLMVTGLAANTGYQVSIGGSAATISPNGSTKTDAGGVLVVSY
jgi:Divergent InlB B-repeat domain